MQFVATTHSPFIIQSIHRDATVDLDRDENGFISYEERSIEDIAEEIMGVAQPQRSRRFLNMVDAAEQYYRAIEDAGAESDARQVDILRAKLDHLEERFADSPAYVALLRLRRLSRRSACDVREDRRHGRQSPAVNDVVQVAKSGGFWSVWMAVVFRLPAHYANVCGEISWAQRRRFECARRRTAISGT